MRNVIGRDRRRCRVALGAVAVWLMAIAAAPPRPFLIADGDTVVFLGDSITEKGRFIEYIAQYFAAAWPDWHVELIDRGGFGHRAIDGLQRLQRDVIALRPQLVVVLFGLNDGRYQPFNPDLLTTYTTALRQIVTRLQAAGIRAALATPTVIDPDEFKGYPGNAADYNDVLGRYAQAVTALGQELQVPVLDVHGALREVQERAKAAQPGFTMIPGGVHPSAPGHLVIAARMLRDLGAPPIVSHAEIDTAAGTVTAANGCAIDALVARDGAVSFSRVEQRWWWPLDADARIVWPWAPDVRALDDVTLTVRGLAAGSYRVRADQLPLEQPVTGAQLAAGIEVPALAPAQWPPALIELSQRVASRQQVARIRLDPLQSALPPGAEKAEILAQMDRLLARLRTEQLPLRRPVASRWEIIPQHPAP